MARDSGYPRTHFAAGPRNPASPSAAMRSKWLKSDPTVDVCLEVYPAPEIRLKKIEMIFNLFQFKKKISVGGMLLIQHACGNLMGAKKKNQDHKLPNGWHDLDAVEPRPSFTPSLLPHHHRRSSLRLICWVFFKLPVYWSKSWTAQLIRNNAHVLLKVVKCDSCDVSWAELADMGCQKWLLQPFIQ